MITDSCTAVLVLCVCYNNTLDDPRANNLLSAAIFTSPYKPRVPVRYCICSVHFKMHEIVRLPRPIARDPTAELTALPVPLAGGEGLFCALWQELCKHVMFWIRLFILFVCKYFYFDTKTFRRDNF